MALAQEQPIAATRLLSAAAARRQTAALGLTPLEAAEVEAAQAHLHRVLAASDFATAWEEGQTRSTLRVE